MFCVWSHLPRSIHDHSLSQQQGSLVHFRLWTQFQEFIWHRNARLLLWLCLFLTLYNLQLRVPHEEQTHPCSSPHKISLMFITKSAASHPCHDHLEMILLSLVIKHILSISFATESMNGDCAVSALAPDASTPIHKISFKVPNIEKFVTRKEKQSTEKKKKNESKSLRDFNSFLFGYASE